MRNLPSPSRPNILAPPWGAQNQNLVRPRKETDSTLQLSCDVVFGSPSADCMGTGICRITARSGVSLSAPVQTQRCQSTVGLLFPIEGGNGMTLVLTRALLCTKLYKTHLRGSMLVLEKACPLPKDIIKSLGLKINALSIGEYSIKEAEGFLRIDFKESSFK
jgi:hypothetical protein